MPLLNITVGDDSFISKHLLLPIKAYEQNLIGSSSNKDEPIIPENGKSTNKIKGAASLETDSFNTRVAEASSINSTEDGNSNKKINWLTVVLAIYFIGASLFFIRFVANFIWIFAYAFKYKSQQIFGTKVIRLEKNSSPFSFFSFIFISQKEYPEDELNKIISHEKVHIQQKHSLDLILFELLFVVQWFNPFVWFYKRAIKITHEYLADQGTLNAGVDLPSYQYSLLNQVLSENNPDSYRDELVSNYNLSIKKRIDMMMKKRSSKLAALKLTVALPILIFLFSAFAFKTNYSDKVVNQNTSESNKFVVNMDTSIKKVNVSVEYLKSLEGEYVSTNNPGRVRRIVFTEVLGTLFGYDDGYTYKLIPIGDGKFINPDDRASLIFDTKDKSAISLLLFGKINLNKLKPEKGTSAVRNKSLAFSLVNVIVSNGADAALSYYKKAKDSSNYFLTENEMNYAGYELLQSGRAKEATVIFKLNTELFPNSFNVYDSYGEALLASGDKTAAIESYKKSVTLNPGSKSGLKVLKEFGINTADFIKEVKLPLEYLKLLEGTYLSTNQPNWMRKIIFEEKDGVLFGEDNGYKYSLIPVGGEKFINPDDGASLVFDTKNKNAISLLLFGTTNLRKVKKSTGPALDLKNYSGVYVPAKKDAILATMEITNSDGKLFRYISDAEGANKTVELVFVGENIFFYTDNSGRSIEFVVDKKNDVTECILRRPDGVYTLAKRK